MNPWQPSLRLLQKPPPQRPHSTLVLRARTEKEMGKGDPYVGRLCSTHMWQGARVRGSAQALPGPCVATCMPRGQRSWLLTNEEAVGLQDSIVKIRASVWLRVCSFSAVFNTSWPLRWLSAWRVVGSKCRHLSRVHGRSQSLSPTRGRQHGSDWSLLSSCGSYILFFLPASDLT